MIVHAYKKALIKRLIIKFIVRCAKPFSVYSLDKAAHVCNTAIVKKELEKDDDMGDDDEGEQKEIVYFFRKLLGS